MGQAVQSNNMKVLLYAAAALALVWGNAEDNLFSRYEISGDVCMDLREWERLWYHFDLNDDGNVSKLEFDTTWRHEDFSDKDRAPFFFLEIDHVPDGVLNEQDFEVMFKLFDENGNGCITSREFRFNWQGIFKDD